MFKYSSCVNDTVIANDAMWIYNRIGHYDDSASYICRFGNTCLGVYRANKSYFWRDFTYSTRKLCSNCIVTNRNYRAFNTSGRNIK